MENNNIDKIMKNIKNIPEMITQSKEIVSKIIVDGESGAGLVKTRLNGKKEILKIKIDPSLMKEDKFIIEDLVLSAINDANKKVDIEVNKKMVSIMQDIGLPDNFISMIPFINHK